MTTPRLTLDASAGNGSSGRPAQLMSPRRDLLGTVLAMPATTGWTWIPEQPGSEMSPLTEWAFVRRRDQEHGVHGTSPFRADGDIGGGQGSSSMSPTTQSTAARTKPTMTAAGADPTPMEPSGARAPNPRHRSSRRNRAPPRHGLSCEDGSPTLTGSPSSTSSRSWQGRPRLVRTRRRLGRVSLRPGTSWCDSCTEMESVVRSPTPRRRGSCVILGQLFPHFKVAGTFPTGRPAK